MDESENDYEGASLAGYSQDEIDWRANIDFHRKHCGRCWNDEECKTLERLWNTKV